MLDSTILLVSTDIHLAEITSHTCIKSSKAQTPDFRRKQFFVFTCFNINLVLFFFCFNIICLSFHAWLIILNNTLNLQTSVFTKSEALTPRLKSKSMWLSLWFCSDPSLKSILSYIGMTMSLRFSHHNFNPD